MMSLNARPSEAIALLGRVSPVSQGAGAVSTAWVPAKNFHRLMAIVQAGVLGASATLDAKLEQAQNASGTGAKDVTGKAITQLTKAGSDDNKEVVINAYPEELDVAGKFDHVRLTLTVGTAASLVAGALYGVGPRYAPASTSTRRRWTRSSADWLSAGPGALQVESSAASPARGGRTTKRSTPTRSASALRATSAAAASCSEGAEREEQA
jgi:hypothetical protein